MASSGINQGIHYLTVAGTQVTHLINVDYDVTNALRKITTKDSTSSIDEYGAGTVNHVMSATAFFAEDATYGFNELQALCAAGTSAALVHLTGVSGDVTWTSTGYIASVGHRSPNLDGSETVEITFQITGVVTEGTT